jgi:hypothetical protein
MRVNVLTGSTSHADGRLMNDLARTVERDLHRLDGRIRNVDVLILEDDDSPDEKWCVVEARIPGRESVAVRAHAGSYQRAVHAGARKLDKVIGESLNARQETDARQAADGDGETRNRNAGNRETLDAFDLTEWQE